MARIDPPLTTGPLTKLSHRVAKRMSNGTMPEPFELMAHRPLLLHGYSAFEMAFKYSKRVPPKLKALAELKAAAIAGCEWCMDYGSWLAREEAGVTEEQLREMPRFRESDAFDDDEKLVIEYAEAISRTPVDVSDELFARMRHRFEDPEIVELTWAAAIENLRARFNWALGIESQDYVEGGFCLRSETAEQSNGAAADEAQSEAGEAVQS